MEQINAEVFVAIARLGSYSRAADALGYTKAGIGYIVKNMEERAGFGLFVREYGGVRLTPEGKSLLPLMQQLVAAEHDVAQGMENLRGLATGQIRLLSFNTVLVCWLPDILQGFREKYPGIEVEVISCEGPDQAIHMLKEGEADCAFLPGDEPDGIDLYVLRREPDVCVVSEEHPLATRTSVRLDELEPCPFIGFPEEEAPYLYRHLAARGIQLNQVMTVDNDYGSLTMISRNIGFSIYPRMTLTQCPFQLKGIPIEDGSETPISLAIRSYDRASLPARAFVDYVLELELDS